MFSTFGDVMDFMKRHKPCICVRCGKELDNLDRSQSQKLCKKCNKNGTKLLIKNYSK